MQMKLFSVVYFFVSIQLSVLWAERLMEAFGPHSQLIEGFDGTFVLPNKDFGLSTYIRLYGQFETPLHNLMRELFDKFLPFDNQAESEERIILDLGINMGIWTVPLSKFPNVKVYGFEPQRHMLSHLRASLLLNSVDNVVPIYGAVGNHTGYVPINDVFYASKGLDELNYGGMSLLGALDHNKYHTINEKKADYSHVPMIALDDFYHTILQDKCPKFIKLDIEHYELFALTGARQMLRQCKPMLVFESHCTLINRGVFLLLHSLGYDMFWVTLTPIDYSTSFATPDLDDFVLQSEEAFNVNFFFTMNVVAVPRAWSKEIKAQYSDILFDIDVAHGKFKVEDRNITYCIKGLPAHGPNGSTERCGPFYVHKFDEREVYVDETGYTYRACFEPISPFIGEYYKNYEHLLVKEA